MRCEIPHRCVRRKYRIRRHSPFRLRNCWEGRSVRASSLLRQNSSSVPLSLGRTRPCKTTASPVCWKEKLQLDNEKRLKDGSEAKVEGFKQIIDSVNIDIDYNGKLFNSEIMDLPDKKAIVEAKYEYTYDKKGKQTVAVKIIDVLGEEYFETFEIEIK